MDSWIVPQFEFGILRLAIEIAQKLLAMKRNETNSGDIDHPTEDINELVIDSDQMGTTKKLTIVVQA
jgi:hypothetical protein